MSNRISLLAALALLCLPLAANAASGGHVKEAANRKLIRAYYAEPDELKRLKFMSDDYKQHTPTIADGKEGLRAFFQAMHDKYPDTKQNIVRMAADGDFVWVYLHTIRNPGDRGLAVVNIFRIDHGKIAEHWDVVQPVPETSANANTMF